MCYHGYHGLILVSSLEENLNPSLKTCSTYVACVIWMVVSWRMLTSGTVTVKLSRCKQWLGAAFWKSAFACFLIKHTRCRWWFVIAPIFNKDNEDPHVDFDKTKIQQNSWGTAQKRLGRQNNSHSLRRAGKEEPTTVSREVALATNAKRCVHDSIFNDWSIC